MTCTWLPAVRFACSVAPSPAAPAAPESWRADRAHWRDEANGVYSLFAVSDGTGGGLTTFVLPWAIKAVEVLEAGGRPVSRQLPHDGRRFNDTIAPLGMAAYRVSLLV